MTEKEHAAASSDSNDSSMQQCIQEKGYFTNLKLSWSFFHLSTLSTVIANWYRSTSQSKSIGSERILLSRGGINFNDSERFCQKAVSVKLGSSVEGSINTVIIDQNGISVDPSDARTNIVICHGFGAGLGFFYRNLEPLSRAIPNSRIFAFDWLGMGRSSRPEFPLYKASTVRDRGRSLETTDDFLLSSSTLSQKAIDFFLDSFEDWRDTVGLKKFTLIGHSLGGYLAALYALKHPERVTKLILASPVGLPENNFRFQGSFSSQSSADLDVSERVAVTGHILPPWLFNLWKANYTPQWLVRALGPMGRRFVTGYIESRMPYLPPDEARELSDYMYHITVDKGSGEYALNSILAPGAWAREPLHSRLASISMPTYFICTMIVVLLFSYVLVDGESDWMDHEHAEAAASHMRVPTKIIRISNAGHQLYLDNPEEFNRIVAAQVSE